MGKAKYQHGPRQVSARAPVWLPLGLTVGRGNSRLVADRHFSHFSGMTDSDAKTPAMIIAPDPDAPGLSQPVTGVDESGTPVT